MKQETSKYVYNIKIYNKNDNILEKQLELLLASLKKKTNFKWEK